MTRAEMKEKADSWTAITANCMGSAPARQGKTSSNYLIAARPGRIGGAFQSLRSFQHLPTRHLVKGRKVSFMMAAAEAARWWSFGESHNGCCFS